MSSAEHQQTKPTFNELEFFANELLGVRIRDNSTKMNMNSLKLSIIDVNANKETRKVTFDPIDVSVDNSKLTDLIQDISFDDEENNVTDQFLDLLEENVNP